jgi:hypothetical protein
MPYCGIKKARNSVFYCNKLTKKYAKTQRFIGTK